MVCWERCRRVGRGVLASGALWVLAGCAPETDVQGAWASAGGPTSARPVSRLTLTPSALSFPRTQVGHAVTAAMRLRNEGQGLAEAALAIPAPFTVSTSSLNLPPGAEHTVELRLEPLQPGPTGAVLLIQTEGQRLEVSVWGEVAPAPPSPSP
jgi:hypothetical protein